MDDTIDFLEVRHMKAAEDILGVEQDIGQIHDGCGVDSNAHICKCRGEKAGGEGVKVISTRFGELDISEDKVLNFPQGLIGMPSLKRFVLLDYRDDLPFMLLQSVDEPEIVFTIVDPLIVKPDYKISIRTEWIKDIGKPDKKNLVMLVILTVSREPSHRITANLMAPLIINTLTMKGKQIVLEDKGLSVRHPVL